MVTHHNISRIHLPQIPESRKSYNFTEKLFGNMQNLEVHLGNLAGKLGNPDIFSRYLQGILLGEVC